MQFAPPKSGFVVNQNDVRDLAPDLLDGQDRLRVMSASYYEGTTVEERALFCVRYGFYLLPTIELVDWLKARIAGRNAIEVAAGAGVLGRHLGIKATDNRMQEWPDVVAHYRKMRQAMVRYGANVQKLDAEEAVRRYRPQVVVAAWLTHKYDANRHDDEGNQWGPDEEKLIRGCEEYILIGNTEVHKVKPIWRLPHEIVRPTWLYSRASNGSPDFIAIWRRDAL